MSDADEAITCTSAKETPPMPLTGEYEPSPWDWVRDQVAEYQTKTSRTIPVIVARRADA